jgi:hypothetical protein
MPFRVDPALLFEIVEGRIKRTLGYLKGILADKE